MIKLSNVTFGYEENQTVLKNYNLLINKGEFVTILGHNGSGKSTLLKILTEVLTPTSGEAIVDGKVSALLELGAGFNPEYTGIQNKRKDQNYYVTGY